MSTAPNVCSYTTLANMNNVKFSRVQQPVLVLCPQNSYFSIPTLHSCVNAHSGQFELLLLKLSSFISVSNIIRL